MPRRPKMPPEDQRRASEPPIPEEGEEREGWEVIARAHRPIRPFGERADPSPGQAHKHSVEAEKAGKIVSKISLFFHLCAQN